MVGLHCLIAFEDVEVTEVTFSRFGVGCAARQMPDFATYSFQAVYAGQAPVFVYTYTWYGTHSVGLNHRCGQIVCQSDPCCPCVNIWQSERNTSPHFGSGCFSHLPRHLQTVDGVEEQLRLLAQTLVSYRSRRRLQESLSFKSTWSSTLAPTVFWYRRARISMRASQVLLLCLVACLACRVLAGDGKGYSRELLTV